MITGCQGSDVEAKVCPVYIKCQYKEICIKQHDVNILLEMFVGFFGVL